VSRRDEYREALRALPSSWEPYLREHSGLPGPRANLELVEAVADEGDEKLFRRLIATDDEYLVVCGLVGLGRLLAEGRHALLAELRAAASDERWRVREGVVLGLQRLGDRDMPRLFAAVEPWANGNDLERRAAAAAVCEPRFLQAEASARRALDLLDALTESVAAADDRRADGFRVLRKGLGYCWSIAVAARPDPGKARMERWLASDDPDVRWIMRENLKKARLARMDPGWVAEMRRR
jgi:hypothetical protein